MTYMVKFWDSNAVVSELSLQEFQLKVPFSMRCKLFWPFVVLVLARVCCEKEKVYNKKFGQNSQSVLQISHWFKFIIIIKDLLDVDIFTT
jgi:hypothetical protein